MLAAWPAQPGSADFPDICEFLHNRRNDATVPVSALDRIRRSRPSNLPALANPLRFDALGSFSRRQMRLVPGKKKFVAL